MIREEQLLRGIIFGDAGTREYVYMPASEVGADMPVYVYEADASRMDVDLAEALRLIRMRDLRPTEHPLLGRTSC
ncbi:hypothetical protein [uncultured Selenomonas sp.]|uniref:hypothetical protein n=1 Tax=uncultured Selenomonas sp. TaxID=159275 RepID=UPI0028D00B53|nr:hypothetical protein [uncultured Selenomonas sp.]